MPVERTRWIRTVIVMGALGVLAACATTPPRRPVSHWPPTLAELRNLPDPKPVATPPSITGNPLFYSVLGRSYHVLGTSEGYDKRGLASWYGPKFQGKKTSTGKRFNMYTLTAAHKTLPIPTYVQVTRLDDGRSIIVKVNDRGPFVNDRLIDLSYAAAVKLGMVGKGTVPVEVRALAPYQYLAGNAHKARDTRIAQQPNTVQSPQGGSPAVTPTAKPAAASLRLASARGDASAHADLAVASGDTSPADAFLQVGAFSELRRADQLRQLLRRNLAQPVKVQRGADALKRVRIGPLHGQLAIEKVRQVLAGLGIQKVYIVRN